jgi:hypothetical protein
MGLGGDTPTKKHPIPPNLPPQGCRCKQTTMDVRKQKSPVARGFQGVLWSVVDDKTAILGGVDGTRTRDPRRDRPVF